MRILFAAAFSFIGFSPAFARPVDAMSYAQLMSAAELVIIVHATGWRPATEGDEIVPIDNDHESLMPIFTNFKVLAVLKGDQQSENFELCHYKYKSFSRRIGNGPLLAWFDNAKTHSVGGRGWVGHADNDFVLFLKRDDAGRWTFVTGQYDSELSVRQITNPIRRGTIFGY